MTLRFQDQDQDQDSEVQDQDQDSAVSRPTYIQHTSSCTKTLMSKTKTETQDLQDQYWKSMTGMDIGQ